MKLFAKLNIPKQDYFKAYLLGLALLCCLFIFSWRLITEQRNSKVELVFDYQDVLLLQAYTGQPQEQIYRMLQKAGITSICVPEDTLSSLRQQGKATWVKGDELLNMSRLGQIQSYILLNLVRSADIFADNYYVLIDQVKTFERAKNSLINELGPERAKVVGPGLIEIKGQVDNMGDIGLGIDNILINDLTWYKFQIMPKLMNSRRLDDVSLGLKISKLSEMGVFNTLLFNGSEVLGYGNNMKLVAEKMRENKFNFGYIEFATQLGDKNLAELLPGQTIGVHSIPLKSLQTYSMEKALDRYLLAAVERGIRILYLHPFIEERHSADLLAYNEEFITKLKTKLERRGFVITPIERINIGINRYVTTLFGFIIGLAVSVLIFNFLKLFFPKLPEVVYNSCFWSLFGLNLLFLFTGHFGPWRSILALIVAVITPTYAMLTQLPKDNNWHNQEIDPKELIKLILRIVGITAIGILLIIGLLSDVYHILKIYQFRGVKIAFGLPLLIVAFYYFLYPYRVNALGFLMKRFLQSQVTIGFVLGSIGVALFFGLYFLRSGNYQLPMINFEESLRDLLGRILFVRPRTKEFLVGYPLLVFTLVNLGKSVDYKYRWILYTLATVAPISLVNTFCHLHAPLWLSIVRSINGLVIGILVGYLFVFVHKLMLRFWKFLA